jgi:hypothetical protein
MMSGVKKMLMAVAVAAFACAVVGKAQAQSAAEKPILTISGKIDGAAGTTGSAGSDEGVVFDRAKLEALGMQAIETKTPWYKDVVKFEGVSLDKLMRSVGAKGDRVVAIALNDYSVEIPMEDFAKHNVILALKRDGEYMSVRDKGPLFVVYPYDSDPELRSQKYYSRSAWQVKQLIVK